MLSSKTDLMRLIVYARHGDPLSAKLSSFHSVPFNVLCRMMTDEQIQFQTFFFHIECTYTLNASFPVSFISLLSSITV